MPRLPYQYPKPGESAIADGIRQRRKADLLELDGVLLNAPQIAQAMNGLGQAVRIDSTLPGDVRELLILRVAALNGAAYEWIQHADVGLRAGLTPAQLAVIRDASTALSDDVDPSCILTETQRACLMYADWMTRNIQVPQRVFDAVRAVLNDRRVTEATATVCCYNAVSRFLVALDVGDMAAVPVPEVEPAHVPQ